MEGKKKFKRLFDPGHIGKMKIKNRIVMSPMATGLATDTGAVSDRLVHQYVERAKGGVGLIIVECTSIDPSTGWSYGAHLGIDSNDKIIGLSRLVDSIHDYDTKVAIQLQHTGRQSHAFALGREIVAPSSIPDKSIGVVPRELTTKEIGEIVEKFSDAAVRAKKAGFDAIEIHGAHGYLITNFMSPYSNHRTDAYGGSFEARMRFPLDVIRRIREKVGEDFPVIFRISGDEFVEGGYHLEDCKAMAPLLVKAGLDALHVSAGIYESILPMMPPMTWPQGCNVYLAEGVKKVIKVPVITVGNIKDPEFAETILEEGRADFVALGRALRADPEWPNKAAEGRIEDIRICISCMEGDGQLLSYLPTFCSVNAAYLREKEYQIKPTNKVKNVIVVGGGPAGMEAARTLSLRGHNVTLYEKTGKLGGQLNLATVPPGKNLINSLTDYLTTQIKKSRVKVELNSVVTLETVQKHNPDAVIIATGAEPYIQDEIPGITSEKVVNAHAVLRGDVQMREELAVVTGGNVVGCETAEFLAENSNQVTIIEALEDIALDAVALYRTDLLSRLRMHNIKIVTGNKVIEIIKEGVVTINKENEKNVFRADRVILALGTKPVSDLANQLEGKVPELHKIGDAREPRKIKNAIHEAAFIARLI